MGMGHATGKNTMAVGVRFHYELLDLYAGQWATVFLPHATRMAFYLEHPLMEYGRFFGGVLSYLMQLEYVDSSREKVYADVHGVGARRVAIAAEYPGELGELPMTRRKAVEYLV